MEIIDIIDWVIPCDEYSDEMFMVDMSQITDDVKPEIASPLDLFLVLAIKMVEDVQLVSTPGLLAIGAHDNDVFEGVTSPIMVKFEHVGPPLSFDILLGYVSLSVDVLTLSSYMDMSLFENLYVSCDITLSTPHSPTSQIFDIDDEIIQHGLDEDSSSASDLSPSDQKVSPTIGDAEIIDLGIVDQLRKLRIGLDLSANKMDNLTQLLRSYLDVFAWSYEDILGLH